MTPTRARRRLKAALGVLFTGAGIAHFTNPDFFAGLVPAALATHRRQINLATGAVQTAGGLCFFIPRLHAAARWSTIALLTPTFPEAINQVRHPDRMKALGIPPRIALARIPAQTLVLALTWWATQNEDHEREVDTGL